MAYGVPGVSDEFNAILKSIHLKKSRMAREIGIDASTLSLVARYDFAPSYALTASIVDCMIKHGADRLIAYRWMMICGYVPAIFGDTAETWWDVCIEGALLTPYERRAVQVEAWRAIANVKAKRAKGVPA